MILHFSVNSEDNKPNRFNTINMTLCGQNMNSCKPTIGAMIHSEGIDG